ncbi:MAG: hypothetical protein HY917_04560 [Candidatus Diapherotrites archaeon]|nr:hypothetical protein [Candidatus Diapherotrites archaeon]
MPYKPVPLPLVERAWKLSRPEKPFVVPDREGHSRSEHRALREKNMLVVRSRVFGGKEPVYQFVAFADPKHWPSFRNVSGLMREAGPAQDNPSAMGTVSVVVLPGKKSVQLLLAQSHFRGSSWRHQNPGKGPFFSRAQASRFLGWRFRALKQAMQFARERNCRFVVEKFSKGLEEFFLMRGGNSARILVTELRRAAKETGMQVWEDGNRAVCGVDALPREPEYVEA